MNKRGFTVMECLMVLFLFLLLLGSTSQVIQLYAQGAHRMRGQGQAGGELYLLLRSLSREVEQTRQLLTPSGAGPFHELTFVLLNPDFEAYPEPPPSPPPMVFQARPPAELATIRYFLSGRQLMREVTTAGRTSLIVYAEPLDGFTTRLLPDATIELELSLVTEGRTLLCKSRVYRP